MDVELIVALTPFLRVDPTSREQRLIGFVARAPAVAAHLMAPLLMLPLP